MSDALDVQLMVADTFASQGRLNDSLGRVLHAVAVSVEKRDESSYELREDIGSLAAECSRINQRLESLTATVGRLMAKVEPLAPGLHSAKVTDAAPDVSAES